jgi:colicin import membrane protein
LKARDDALAALADAITKAEKKPTPSKPKAEPKKPTPNLDESRIENKLALLDKREAKRQTITNSMVSPASLGSPTANSSYLAQSWIGAFRERVKTCWDIPAGSLDVADLVVNVHVQFNRDGSLAAEPVVVNEFQPGVPGRGRSLGARDPPLLALRVPTAEPVQRLAGFRSGVRPGGNVSGHDCIPNPSRY